MALHQAYELMTIPTTAPEAPDSDRLRARYEAIAAALAGHPPAEQRATLKAEIVALFRDADAAVNAMTAFKESVKRLATSWKQQEGRAPSPSRPAVSARIDHLGASTFVEKGWSRL